MRRLGSVWLGAVLNLSCLVSLAGVPRGNAQTSDTKERLKFAIVLMRHGVRSPTWAEAKLNEYSRSPWPTWDVAPGLLTPHGKKLVTQFGTYYRQVFAQEGLLSSSGCGDSDHVYIYTDSDERTISSGQGFLEGLLSGCKAQIHSVGESGDGSIFHPGGKAGRANPSLAVSATAGRIGSDPAALLPAYQSQLGLMQKILSTCTSEPCSSSPKKRLLALPSSLAEGTGDHLVEMKGPLAVGSTLAENLQLEFLEGMPERQVGWGQGDEETVRSLMLLHAASSDIVQRTPYIAKAQATLLLKALLSTMQQAVEHEAVPGAVGKPADKLVVLVGHDTNIANVAALLDAHWLVNGYQRDDAAPGGGLVFELWETSAHEKRIRIYYSVERPGQMRNASPPTLSSPAGKSVIFLPGCAHSSDDAACDWDSFRKLVEASTSN